MVNISKDEHTKFFQEINGIQEDSTCCTGLNMEYTVSLAVNRLVLRDICPNFVLTYSFLYDDPNGKQSMIILTELGDSDLRHWALTERPDLHYYVLLFQLLAGAKSLYKHCQYTMGDVKPENIIVLKDESTKENHSFVIDDIIYNVSNIGYLFCSIDFDRGFQNQIKSPYTSTDTIKHGEAYSIMSTCHAFMKCIDLVSRSPNIDRLYNILRKIYDVNDKISTQINFTKKHDVMSLIFGKKYAINDDKYQNFEEGIRSLKIYKYFH